MSTKYNPIQKTLRPARTKSSQPQSVDGVTKVRKSTVTPRLHSETSAPTTDAPIASEQVRLRTMALANLPSNKEIAAAVTHEKAARKVKAVEVARHWEKSESWVSKMRLLDQPSRAVDRLALGREVKDKEMLTTIARIERYDPAAAMRLVETLIRSPKVPTREIVQTFTRQLKRDRLLDHSYQGAGRRESPIPSNQPINARAEKLKAVATDLNETLAALGMLTNRVQNSLKALNSSL
jgi:hypothetical protein